jgi:hypothetical protein
MLPLPKGTSIGAAAHLLLHRVGGERRQHRAATGQHTQQRAQRGAAQHRREGILEVLLGRPQAVHVLGEDLAVLGRAAQVGGDLGEAEDAHRDRDEVDAVGQLGNVEAVTRHAGDDVGVDLTEQQAEDDHAQRLDQRARRQHHGADQAQHHQAEVFGRAELERQLGQRRREGRDDQRAHAAGEERSQPGRGQRRPGSALACHRVAVDRGDHRRGLARQVDQDRGGRAAVLRTVVDAGQHDQRRRGIQRVDRRQQHRDRGGRPETRQHADRGAKHGSPGTRRRGSAA